MLLDTTSPLKRMFHAHIHHDNIVDDGLKNIPMLQDVDNDAATDTYDPGLHSNIIGEEKAGNENGNVDDNEMRIGWKEN